jgi:hypothetical protein
MSNLWDIPGVPHKGWYCTNVEDLGQAIHTCEMCGQEQIRFVHEMCHKEHRPLLVGCICAEHMAEDYRNPKLREQVLRNKASRRSRWLTRKWKISAKGNPYLKVKGNHIVAYPRGTAYCLCINGEFGMKTYATLDAARLSAFDYLESLSTHSANLDNPLAA